MILRAYIDKALLQSIETGNVITTHSKIYLGKQTNGILGHICELAKCDLALSIWKVYIDPTTKANTLKQLNNFLRGNNRAVKLVTKYPVLHNDIAELRKKYLAHEDVKKSGKSIEINALYEALDEIKDMYNGLCDSSVDDRVRQIKENEIGAISWNVLLGYLSLIPGCYSELKNSENNMG